MPQKNLSGAFFCLIIILKNMRSRKNILLMIALALVLSSCGAIAHVFYDKNDICSQDKTRKGKFNQKDMDRRAKSTK
jgi:hypothetical protein